MSKAASSMSCWTILLLILLHYFFPIISLTFSALIFNLIKMALITFWNLSIVFVSGINTLIPFKIVELTAVAIEEICSKIKLPSVEIRGIMEITNNKTDGVEIIKKTLLDELKKDSTIDITYLGAPKYRLSITSDNFKSAEKSLKPIIAEIQTNIEKKKDSFKFTREESKKTREG